MLIVDRAPISPAPLTASQSHRVPKKHANAQVSRETLNSKSAATVLLYARENENRIATLAASHMHHIFVPSCDFDHAQKLVVKKPRVAACIHMRSPGMVKSINSSYRTSTGRRRIILSLKLLLWGSAIDYCSTACTALASVFVYQQHYNVKTFLINL